MHISNVMIAVFLAVIQSILFLGHYVVYKTVVRFFGITDPSHLWWAKVLFIVLSVSFVLVSALTYKGYLARGAGTNWRRMTNGQYYVKPALLKNGAT